MGGFAMKQRIIRWTIVGTGLFLGLGLLTPSAARADVPDEWGDPVVSIGLVEVTALQVGRLPGRLGNQHVVRVGTLDEESVISGDVYDWWCPAGATAPANPTVATTCRLKATFIVDHDWPEPTHHAWGPGLRWMTLRIPIVLRDGATTDVVSHGKVSLRVRASGDLTQVWHEGDYLDVLTREDARVVGGAFLGRQWLNMRSLAVTDGSLSVLRYYDPS